MTDTFKPLGEAAQKVVSTVEETQDHDRVVRVGLAVFDLQSAIDDIDKLRMANDTADLVLKDYQSIVVLSKRLNAIADDLHQSVHKQAAE